MDFVAVDLGASNTRYTNKSGKVGFIPNSMYFVTGDLTQELNNPRIDDVPENNLDVTVSKEGDVGMFPMRALVGMMANRISREITTPSQQKNKTDQPINYMSIVLAIALSKLKNPDIGEEINLFSLLPPSEVQRYREQFVKNLKGKYTVVFNKIEVKPVTITFTINNVYCFEESRMAIIQFLFDGAHPERMTEFGAAEKNLLSIDIGASTTDLATFQGGVFLEKSGYTIKAGCNIARDYIMEEVSALRGRDISIEEATEIMIEGRMRNGNTYASATDIVDAAKRKVAHTIIKKMDTYYDRINMSLDYFNYVIVSGGGSMESSYIDANGDKKDTSKPMTYYIEEVIKEHCPGVDVIHFGDEPRTANIRGLGMYALLTNGVVEQ